MMSKASLHKEATLWFAHNRLGWMALAFLVCLFFLEFFFLGNVSNCLQGSMITIRLHLGDLAICLVVKQI